MSRLRRLGVRLRGGTPLGAAKGVVDRLRDSNAQEHRTRHRHAHAGRATLPGCALSIRRAGFSLFEVILALAILTGAIAMLGELVRIGLWHSQVARDETQAELLCESKLAEIAAGVITPDAVSGAAADQAGLWVYSIEPLTSTQDGVLALQVTVSQNVTGSQRPVRCSVVRWMVDPNYQFPQKPAANTIPEDTSTSTSSTTGNSSSSNGSSGSGKSSGGTSGGKNSGGSGGGTSGGGTPKGGGKP